MVKYSYTAWGELISVTDGDYVKKFIILILIVISVSFLLVIAFYIIPVQKINETISFANKNDITSYNTVDWISYENFKLLDITEGKLEKENTYISLETDKIIESISLGEISITYTINVIVKDWETLEVLGTYSGIRTIQLNFSSFKWIVTTVK